MRRRYFSILAVVLACVLVPAAMATPVTIRVDFTNAGGPAGVGASTGNGGLFTVTLTTAAVGVTLDALSINLGGAVFFDTAAGAPGSGGFGSNLPVGLVTSGPPADGSTTYAMTFSSFDPGDTTSFELDMDDANSDVFPADLATATISGPVFGGPLDYTGPTSAIFSIVNGNFRSAEITGDLTVVPEPTTYLLVGAGLLGLGLIRRRYQRGS